MTMKMDIYKEETKMTKSKEFTYEELKAECLQVGLKTQFNVVSYLIGYNGFVDATDWNLIIELYMNGVVRDA